MTVLCYFKRFVPYIVSFIYKSSFFRWISSILKILKELKISHKQYLPLHNSTREYPPPLKKNHNVSIKRKCYLSSTSSVNNSFPQLGDGCQLSIFNDFTTGVYIFKRKGVRAPYPRPHNLGPCMSNKSTLRLDEMLSLNR